MRPLNPKISDWARKRVWIVGASTGMGAALARTLAARGAWIALSARDPDTLAEVQRDCPSSLSLPMDVTRNGDYASVLTEIRTHWGGIDLVVFNAGTYAPLRAWEMAPDSFRHVFGINVFGVTDGVTEVLPGLLEQGKGAIAIVASVAGYAGLPKAIAYGASKAALINFAETLYLDLAPRGIGVHLINPGFVDTPLTRQNDFHMPALITPEQAAEAMVKGFARGAFEIHFPRRFTRVMKMLRMLPYRLYFLLVGRIAP